MNPSTPDIQGHRGARGLLPENTIPAFKKALDLGVTTLELDLCVTGDGQLIVSHEPWLSPEICLTPEGEEIPEELNMKLNVYQMKYDEIRNYDCGSKNHERFPDQEKLKTFKPLLIDMILEVEQYGSSIEFTDFNYNIEIKSQPEGDSIFHPIPSVFSDMVYASLDTLLDWNRITIQSFDFRVLRYFHDTYHDVSLAALVEEGSAWNQHIDTLGFTPEIYSPYFKLLTQQSIAEMQQSGMEIIPWTINSKADMKQFIEWGVDGIITDYPNIALDLIKSE
jgi:glycerophosphoryl diester phosphodiesterase